MQHLHFISKYRLGQKTFFFLYIGILLLPNLVLFITEPPPVWARFCNVIIPLAVYWLFMTFFRKPGKPLWILLPLLFVDIFQLVLLSLFKGHVIAVDMFLNLLTTNTAEAAELLSNLWPTIAAIFALYLVALFSGIYSLARAENLSTDFLKRQRKYALSTGVAGIILLAVTGLSVPRYRITTGIYPINVGYNIVQAVRREIRVRHYARSSADFRFYALPEHPVDEPEIYVLVIGETSRACNWQLYGYPRQTNPHLSSRTDILCFRDVLTQSNTTHKSVPLLLSSASALHYDRIYREKSLITAFREAGFRTAFFSNQRPNRSFIDFFGQEADRHIFVKESSENPQYNPSDEILLQLLADEIDRRHRKSLIVLHTYGSHFNYGERYPADRAYFRPDNISGTRAGNRKELVNAYDNSIRYTDNLLHRIISLLDRNRAQSAVLYIADHGEDIFDDSRNRFLHSSPGVSYYQLHVPLVLWMSEGYKKAYPSCVEQALANRDKAISTRNVFHTVLSLGGIHTFCREDSLSIVSPCFKETARYYLDDHNRARTLDEIGLTAEDFEQFGRAGIRH
ncbi:MAG: sulfatase-like hydrolase/transferase [Coprobacter sp.]|nr:sulfatase-like hydrolase/transferase [Coprobacter sp.]